MLPREPAQPSRMSALSLEMPSTEFEDSRRFCELMDETRKLGDELTNLLNEAARVSEDTLKKALINKTAAFTKWAKALDDGASREEIDSAERIYREALAKYEAAGIEDFSAQKRVRQMKAKLAPLNREATALGFKLGIFCRIDCD